MARIRLPARDRTLLAIVLVVAVLGALAEVFYFRSRATQAVHTDGHVAIPEERLEVRRLVHWVEPDRVFGDTPTADREWGAALNAAGTQLVYVVGEPGTGTELWLAERQDGLAGAGWRKRRLSELSSPADEASPCLSRDGQHLFFASDREGGHGGLDLYVAARDGARFLAPLNLGPLVNSAGDDTDPALGPDGRWLLFASDRAGPGRVALDLYEARRGDRGFESPRRLDALCSAYVDRAPTAGADGQTVVFASNRPGGRGGLDLYRSVKLGEQWRPPEPIRELNTGQDESDPALSGEGFSLFFTRDGGEVLVTHTRELYRWVHADAPWLSRFGSIVLAVLVLLLTVYLARRWAEMGLLGRCVAASVLAHLLLFLYFNQVMIRGGVQSFGERPGRYRVTLVPPGPVLPPGKQARNQARGDRLARPPVASTPRAAQETVAAARPALNRRVLARLEPYQPDPERSERTGPGARPAVTVHDRIVAGPEKPVRPERQTVARAETASKSVAMPPRHGPERAERPDLPAPPSGGAASPARHRMWPLAMAASAASGTPEPAPERSDARRVRSAPPARTGAVALAEPVAPRPPSHPRPAPRPEPRPSTPVARTPAQAAPAVARARADTTAPRVAATAPRTRPRLAGPPRARAAVPEAPTSPAERHASRVQPTPGRESLAGPAAPRPSDPVAAGSRRVPAPRVVEARDPGTLPARTAPVSPDRTEGPARPGQTPPTASVARDRSDRWTAPRVPGPALPGLTPPVPALRPRVDPGRAAPGLDPLAAAPPVARALRSRDPRPQARDEARAARQPAGLAPLATRSDPVAATGGDRPAPRPRPAVTRPSRRPAPLDPRTGLEPSDPTGLGQPARPGSARPLGRIPDRALARTNRPEPRAARLPPTRKELEPRPLPDVPCRAPLVERERVPQTEPLDDRRPHDLLARAAPPELEPAHPGRPEAAVMERETSLYAHRSGQARLRALREYGGTAESERAVRNGLAYLARVQRPDGSWGNPRYRHHKYGQVQIGKTGLALLAFLASGHTPKSRSRYASHARRAIAYLVEAQDRRTGHIGNGSAYSHGIATYALAEAYAMTRDATLRDPLQRAVDRILTAQITDRKRPLVYGGWSYYYATDRIWDEWPRASVTAWQVMALKSAQIGGLTVPPSALAAARVFLQRSFDRREGYFRYSHDPDRLRSSYRTLPGSTPAAVFALLLLGEDPKHERIQKSVDFVMERAPRRYRRGSDDRFVLRAEGNVYFWYYATLALFTLGGDTWTTWNASLRDLLVKAQDRDGSWAPISPYATYANDTRSDRSYTTALCVLMLEVYYRYVTPLLTYRPEVTAHPDDARIPSLVVLRVVALRVGSVAGRAGVRVGDEVVRYNGQKLTDLDQLEALVETHRHRARVDLDVLRAGRPLRLRVPGGALGMTVEERRE